MKQKKLIYKIIFITVIGSAIILFLSFYLVYINSNTDNKICITKDPVLICGTDRLPLEEDASQGKIFFNTNCVACHKLDAKCTGPALRNSDSLTLVKWLLPKKDKKINENNFDKMGLDYHLIMWRDIITEKEIKNLNAYINHTCTIK